VGVGPQTTIPWVDET